MGCLFMRQTWRAMLAALGVVALGVTHFTDPALAQAQPQAAPERRPNILVIMGDDIGWFNIGAYHQGIMSGKTPNLDRLAAEGMRFTDYYAEASCTAGRANFITGELLTSPAASRADSAAPRSGRLRSG